MEDRIKWLSDRVDRLALKQDRTDERMDRSDERQAEQGRQTAAALSLVQTQLAEYRVRREEQSGDWGALKATPSRLSILEARFDAFEADGRWLDRWVGDTGYLRSYYFIVLLLIVALSVGALQAETLVTLTEVLQGVPAAPSPTPRDVVPPPPPILGPGPTP